VPLGLDDPTAYIPPSNPLTLQKWELGKRLFFDEDRVLPANAQGKKMSCASCHNPATGFTDKRIPDRNPATLINSVYNAHQFWDGRAIALEEVVQRSLEDERDTGADGFKRHAWSGVVGRLRANKEYVAQFRRAFGTPPTQDSVGKALACYLRTILSGDALHDRAERAMKERGGNQLETRDYEKILNEAALKALQEPGEGTPPKAEIAQELFAGWQLFHGKAGCVHCHGGRQFTDHAFHNIGEGDSNSTRPPGEEIGRFASLPAGLKDRRLIGAYKTPSLRALPRTAPYLHDGLRQELFEVVHLHVKPTFGAPNLDPEIRDRELSEGEKRALTRFLRALDGGPVPPEVTAVKGP
jgi:cytochrome c peroxidase